MRGAAGTTRCSVSSSRRTRSTARARSAPHRGPRGDPRILAQLHLDPGAPQLELGEPVVHGNRVVVEWWALMRDEGQGSDAALAFCCASRAGALRGAARVLEPAARPARSARRLGSLALSPRSRRPSPRGAREERHARGRGRHRLPCARSARCRPLQAGLHGAAGSEARSRRGRDARRCPARARHACQLSRLL